MASIAEFIAEWNSPGDYICAHTSGSTGTPKAIRLLKSDMSASARATNRRFGITAESVLGLPLSVDYIAGKMMCVRAIEAGCRLIEMDVSNNVTVGCRIDLLAIVPSQVDSLLVQPDAPHLVKNLIVGGAPLDEKRKNMLCGMGFRAYSTYGMTETCSHVALSDLSDGSGVYRAMPGISFDVESRGCLVIEAPAFSFGRLVTNDIVELIDRFSFKWLGRFDNVINSGGLKISAEQLENKIRPLVDVEFYVVGCKDDRWGEVPVMVFEGSPNQCEPLLQTLRANLDHRLCPKRVIAVDRLPRTANGKIIRQEI